MKQLTECTERDPSLLAGMMVPAADDSITAAGRRRADDPGFSFGQLLARP